MSFGVFVGQPVPKLEVGASAKVSEKTKACPENASEI